MTRSTRLKRALSTFTARSPQRDAEVDRNRFVSLKGSIGELIQAITAERLGIVQRVKRPLEDTNLPSPSWTSGRRPRLSKAEFVVLENRLHVLDRQLLKLREVEAMILDLSGIVETPLQDDVEVLNEASLRYSSPAISPE